ncbi:MAG: lysylphosphatidylglycerol synthase transmembrane domain-containing protein [Acidimicrobiales bacterium]
MDVTARDPGLVTVPTAPAPRPSRRAIALRLVFLALSAAVLYGLLPELGDLASAVPELSTIALWWFVPMVVLEGLSFACTWALIRVAIPDVPWFVAATSQLTANAVSRAVPGGAAVGTTMGWRMLSVAGVDRGTAGTALAANAFISNGVLFAIPVLALLASLLGAPIPDSMHVVAWGGSVLFLVLFGSGFVLVHFDRPIRVLGDVIHRVAAPLQHRLHRPATLDGDALAARRDVVVVALGSRWRRALAAAVGNWLFDYLALVCALLAVGARPRPSLVLLAYGFAAVLAMVPITPGGIGVVEAGLSAMLTLAHIGARKAVLATLAYRLVSFWLTLPVGLVAYLWFRRRYGHPPRLTPEAPAPDAAPPA